MQIYYLFRICRWRKIYIFAYIVLCFTVYANIVKHCRHILQVRLALKWISLISLYFNGSIDILCAGISCSIKWNETLTRCILPNMCILINATCFFLCYWTIVYLRFTSLSFFKLLFYTFDSKRNLFQMSSVEDGN